MSFNYYSSRKERLSQASTATKRTYEKRNGSYFKRNPHLKILVIDLVLVLLFGVIILPFFLRIAKDVRFDDYKVESKAILFEDKVLVSIKVLKLYKKISNRVATDSIKVVIIKGENNLDSSINDLPINSGESKYITFKLENERDREMINIELSSGDFFKAYKVKIQY